MITWTCGCQTPSYELCAAGGLYFIRRIAATSIHESTRWRYREAEATWSALLKGEVH